MLQFLVGSASYLSRDIDIQVRVLKPAPRQFIYVHSSIFRNSLPRLAMRGIPHSLPSFRSSSLRFRVTCHCQKDGGVTQSLMRANHGAANLILRTHYSTHYSGKTLFLVPGRLFARLHD